MPTVRFDDSESEGLAAPAAGAAGLRGDVARVASNLALADHIGKFVAGEVSHKFVAESIADRLKGRNAIHVSFSWG